MNKTINKKGERYAVRGYNNAEFLGFDAAYYAANGEVSRIRELPAIKSEKDENTKNNRKDKAVDTSSSDIDTTEATGELEETLKDYPDTE